MTKFLPLALALSVLCLPLAAQNTPPPAAPPSPFTGYLGRFLDSASTDNWYYPNRTLRADMIKIDRARDRIYVKAGDGYLLGYKLSTFVSSLGLFNTGPHGEQVLPYAMHVNAETDPGWQIVVADGSVRLSDFDFDARGYIYLAYTIFGFGVVDSTGHLLRQVTSVPGSITPNGILTFASAGHQYVIVSNRSTQSALYDFTTPATPAYLGLLGFGISGYAKNSAGDAIAILRPNATTLDIYTPATLVANGTPTSIPATTVPGGTCTYKSVTTDGSKFYAAQDCTTAVTILSSIAPDLTVTEVSRLSATLTLWPLTYGSGYLTWAGWVNSAGGYVPSAVVYRFDGTNFTKYDMTSYLQANYSATYVRVEQIVPFCAEAAFYGLFAARGLGDVFSLTPAASACLPGAPTTVTATAGNGSAQVSFTAPLSDGGAAVTSYVVTSTPRGITATGTMSPITITGLANGENYWFTVAAVNPVGIGPQSLPSNTVTPMGPLATPAAITATANGTNLVHVQWTPVTGALYYEIFRGTGGAALSLFATSSDFVVSVDDASVVPNTTYLYSVRAVDAADNRSGNSPVDAATTVVFTDDPLIAGTTGVLATHVNELRTAVNAMRQAAGLAPVTFTDATLDSNTPIKAVHVTELRAALDEARSAIGLPPLTYTDPTITPGDTPVKAVHLQEIRNGVK